MQIKLNEFVSAIKAEIVKQLKDDMASIIREVAKEEISSLYNQVQDLQAKMDDLEENYDPSDISELREKIDDLDYRLEDLEGYDINDIQDRLENVEYYDLDDIQSKVDDLDSSIYDKVDMDDVVSAINSSIDGYLESLKQVEKVDNVINNIVDEDEEEME